MDIEGNFDATINLTSRTITIQYPESYGATVEVLKYRLLDKRVRQLYAKIAYPRKPRTTGEKSQNRHLNGHIQQMAQEWGDSFDEVKMHVKREAISMGYPYHTTKWGEVVPESEADASTVECSYLIDTAHRIASDMGIALKEF